VAKSSVCFAAVKQLLSVRYFDKSKGCPYTANTRGHYTTAQQLVPEQLICIIFCHQIDWFNETIFGYFAQGFGKSLVESVVAELGDRISPEVRNALQATVFAV
jgi:hypothetical protein